MAGFAVRDPLRMRKLSVGRHTAGCPLLAIYVFEGLRLAFQPFLLGLDVHRVSVVLELGVDMFGAPLADFVSHDLLTAATEELLHCIAATTALRTIPSLDKRHGETRRPGVRADIVVPGMKRRCR